MRVQNVQQNSSLMQNGYKKDNSTKVAFTASTSDVVLRSLNAIDKESIGLVDAGKLNLVTYALDGFKGLINPRYQKLNLTGANIFPKHIENFKPPVNNYRLDKGFISDKPVVTLGELADFLKKPVVKEDGSLSTQTYGQYLKELLEKIGFNGKNAETIKVG